MGCQNVVNLVAHFVQLVIDIEDGAARITENGVDSLLLQTFKQDSCAIELHEKNLLSFSNRYIKVCSLYVRLQTHICHTGLGVMQKGCRELRSGYCLIETYRPYLNCDRKQILRGTALHALLCLLGDITIYRTCHAAQ